jgi:hypothetical protein
MIPAGFLLFHHRKVPPTLPAVNPALQTQLASAGVPPVQGTQVQPNATKNPTKSPVDIAGKWKATVKYDWGGDLRHYA